MLQLAEAGIRHFRADGLALSRALASISCGHVDADHVALGSHLTRGEETVEPGAAAEVDHRFSWPQRGDRLRIAATQAEIGAVRDRRQFGVGVTMRRAFSWASAGADGPRQDGAQQPVASAVAMSPYRARTRVLISVVSMWVRPFPGSMCMPWQARPIMSTTFGELSYHRGFVLAMNAATGSPGGRCRNKSRSVIGLWYSEIMQRPGVENSFDIR